MQNKSLQEWAEIESDDMFQRGDFCGGFDGIEEEFCFSLYVENKEYWFQLSLTDTAKIVSGELKYINIEMTT